MYPATITCWVEIELGALGTGDGVGVGCGVGVGVTTGTGVLDGPDVGTGVGDCVGAEEGVGETCVWLICAIDLATIVPPALPKPLTETYSPTCTGFGPVYFVE